VAKRLVVIAAHQRDDAEVARHQRRDPDVDILESASAHLGVQRFRAIQLPRLLSELCLFD